jgi:hypothetical protein
MATEIQCSACRVWISARASDLVICPGCGARLRVNAKDGRPVVSGNVKGTKKNRQKLSRRAAKYPLYVGIGGGALLLGVLVVVIAIALQQPPRHVAEVKNNFNGQAGRDDDSKGGSGVAGPPWLAKNDPAKENVSPKESLSIAIQGQAVFASGQSPFVADFVPVAAGSNDSPTISVYDIRTGEPSTPSTVLRLTQSSSATDGSPYAALGPEGKTLAAVVSSTTKSGKRSFTTNEILLFRLGKDAPTVKFSAPHPVSWMQFGKDDNQLIIASFSGSALFAASYDLKQASPSAVAFEIQRDPTRWRTSFGHFEAWAISPGRNFLAIGEGRLVELIRLSDGKSAGQCFVPGNCISVAFSIDGSELLAHSRTSPAKGAKEEPQFHWSSFSMNNGKRLTFQEVTGGGNPGAILAAGPKPGLAVHSDGARATVTDTRLGAPVVTVQFRAIRYLEGDRLLGYDANAKRVTVQRFDPEQIDSGEKAIAKEFKPRPDLDAADRTDMITSPAPTGWNVPVDAADANSVAVGEKRTIAGGAEFLLPWTGGKTLSALTYRRVEKPRVHFALDWQQIDLATGDAKAAVELWSSAAPVGNVPALRGPESIIADHTADGSFVAVRDPMLPTRVDVWDQSGKRLCGFQPYGEKTAPEAIAWVANDRFITRGAGKITGWQVPGPKAYFEAIGYAGPHALSPGRKWIAVQAEKYVDVYESATGKPLGRMDRAHPDGKVWQGLTVSHDGRRLAALDLSRPNQNAIPGVWAYAVWDLQTGMLQDSRRIFGGVGYQPARNPLWVGPRQILAGGAEVIDIDAQAVTATVKLDYPYPLSSPDGRFWGGRNDHLAIDATHQPPIESVAAIDIEETIKAVPRPAAADVVFRDGRPVEVVSDTEDATRDAIFRSTLGQMLTSEGYVQERGGWKFSLTGKSIDSGVSVTTLGGKKVAIPKIEAKVQLIDAAGAVAWETQLKGGFDKFRSKYRMDKETSGPGGGGVPILSFGSRDPREAMDEEAWFSVVDTFRKAGSFPRVFARVNGKIVQLPIAVPLAQR